MRRFKISILMTLILLVSTEVLAQKPKIRILATGGTIAGVSASATSSAYGAGQVGNRASAGQKAIDGASPPG